MSLCHESDVFAARQLVREMADLEGMSEADTEAFVTAVSEITRNVLVHAGRGELGVRVQVRPEGRWLVVVVVDHGDGIPDLERAFVDGYSTGGGLGLGLSGARRLADSMDIDSVIGRGTTVTLRKSTRRAPEEKW
jgi:serine/threonine-protein kinase RsbT